MQTSCWATSGCIRSADRSSSRAWSTPRPDVAASAALFCAVPSVLPPRVASRRCCWLPPGRRRRVASSPRGTEAFSSTPSTTWNCREHHRPHQRARTYCSDPSRRTTCQCCAASSVTPSVPTARTVFQMVAIVSWLSSAKPQSLAPFGSPATGTGSASTASRSTPRCVAAESVVRCFDRFVPGCALRGRSESLLRSPPTTTERSGCTPQSGSSAWRPRTTSAFPLTSPNAASEPASGRQGGWSVSLRMAVRPDRPVRRCFPDDEGDGSSDQTNGSRVADGRSPAARVAYPRILSVDLVLIDKAVACVVPSGMDARRDEIGNLPVSRALAGQGQARDGTAFRARSTMSLRR